jgi:hypothetical protein
MAMFVVDRDVALISLSNAYIHVGADDVGLMSLSHMYMHVGTSNYPGKKKSAYKTCNLLLHLQVIVTLLMSS